MTNNARKEVEKTFSFYRRATIAEGYVCRYSAEREGPREIDSWRVRRVPGRTPEKERSVRSRRSTVQITVPGNRQMPEKKKEQRSERSRSKREENWRNEKVDLISKDTRTRTMKRVREEDIRRGSQVKRKAGAGKGKARKRVDRKQTPESSSSSSSSSASSSEGSSSEDSSSEEEEIKEKTPEKKSAKKRLTVKRSVTMGVLMDIIEEAKKEEKRLSKREILKLCRDPIKKKKSD